MERNKSNLIPVYKPFLGKKEEEYVLDCFRSGWVSSMGHYVNRFEKLMASHYNVKHAVALSSCTAALHLGLLAMEIGPGDEVIIPDFTLIVSASSVIWTGATPVMTDVDTDTWCMDPFKIEDAISEHTKAIMPVHMYGHPVHMKALMSLAKKYNLKILADCAHAHGAQYDHSEKNILGHVGVFSFYGNKTLTTGEGGMLLTDDDSMAAKVRLLMNQAFKEPRFQHDALGFNYRMTNIQAAIGCAQVEQFDKVIRLKRNIAESYTNALSDLPHIQLPTEKEWAKNAFWVYGIVLKKPLTIDRDTLIKSLYERGVDTRPFFFPLHRQPVFLGNEAPLGKNYPDVDGAFPISDQIGENGLYLPSSPNLTMNEITYICHTLRELLS